MYIQNLTVDKFRNYEHESLSLSPGTNIFYGNNAQGKTNLLEAVYLFSSGKSHRARTDAELIKFGENIATLSLSFSDSQRDFNAIMRFSKDGKKQIKINNVPIKKLSMLMSYLNVVMFSPEDLEMVKGAPSARRRFIDESISQLYPNYLSNLITYHKILMQKNSLLRSLHSSSAQSDATLEIWNEQLASCGALIYRYRRDFIGKINEISRLVHKDISGEEFKLLYHPGIKLSESDDKLCENFYEALLKNQKREIEMGTSLIGIQRDDLKIFINDNDAKLFGSQGQQRTCVLTLKMAETEFIKSVRDEYPVLLLDDIMSELDENRRTYLRERITDKQVLLTCTDADIVKISDNAAMFHIENGQIKK